jgi:hypothetical protein
VIEADSGQQALDLLRNGLRPAILIISFGLRDVPSHTLVAYLRNDVVLREVPVVVVADHEAERRPYCATPGSKLFRPAVI